MGNSQPEEQFFFNVRVHKSNKYIMLYTFVNINMT